MATSSSSSRRGGSSGTDEHRRCKFRRTIGFGVRDSMPGTIRDAGGIWQQKRYFDLDKLAAAAMARH